MEQTSLSFVFCSFALVLVFVFVMVNFNFNLFENRQFLPNLRFFGSNDYHTNKSDQPQVTMGDSHKSFNYLSSARTISDYRMMVTYRDSIGLDNFTERSCYNQLNKFQENEPRFYLSGNPQNYKEYSGIYINDVGVNNMLEYDRSIPKHTKEKLRVRDADVR